MHEDFMTYNRCIPSFIKNIDLDFYWNIRWQNRGVNGKADSMVIGLAVTKWIM
jgi:hypothetical protein